MVALSRTVFATLVAGFVVLAAGPVPAQSLDEQLGAWAGEMAARAVTVVAGQLASDNLIVQAINRAAERDINFDRLQALPALCDRPAVDRCGGPAVDEARGGAQSVAGWQQWAMNEGARYLLMPDLIDGLWRAKKMLVIKTVEGLEPEKKTRLLNTIDGTIYALSIYVSDIDGIRQAFLDRRAAFDLWHKDAGLRARTVQQSATLLAERMKKLAVDADKLELADRLWSAGGEALLAALLRAGNDLRRQLRTNDQMQGGKPPA